MLVPRLFYHETAESDFPPIPISDDGDDEDEDQDEDEGQEEEEHRRDEEEEEEEPIWTAKRRISLERSHSIDPGLAVVEVKARDAVIAEP
jgi:hypothetical protein